MNEPRLGAEYALIPSMLVREARDCDDGPVIRLEDSSSALVIRAYEAWREILVNMRSKILEKLPWAREVAALREVVAEMREELQGARDREKRARYIAFHDDLTALPNRRYFLERLRVALDIRGSRPLELAVFYVDLDGFKSLNDIHGHDAGDRLLALVGARLFHAVRAEDLVSRLGGDEFACMITGVSSRARLQGIAETLFDAVSTPFKIGSLSLTVRPSIGLAVYPSDGATPEALMKAADTAMYAAKRHLSSESFSMQCSSVSHGSMPGGNV